MPRRKSKKAKSAHIVKIAEIAEILEIDETETVRFLEVFKIWVFFGIDRLFQKTLNFIQNR